MYAAESGDYAAELLKRTVLSERCWQQPLVLHADNGAPMKSQGTPGETGRAEDNTITQSSEGEQR
ncbi:TPA: hypothetical protein G8V49_005049 [Salmonella enterica]|uniref:Uncharacterized protein n=1 Tax=Salmonella enterica TaxID=28901 RepID=A0A759WIH2_SALER|nr:hypothetical protein [Salmonella enterica]EEM9513066.1 hypothetical protein [Salmonella enterica]HAG2212691.1 hypothetical protein [Salmonella enterica]